LRGIKNGFDHGLRTLLTLHGIGMKDIGFGMTVSDRELATDPHGLTQTFIRPTLPEETVFIITK